MTLKAMGFDHGVIVDEVKKGGPADKAGTEGADIILGLNGQPVKDGDDLIARVADTPVGTPVTLNIDRDGKKMDFKLIIQDRVEVYADEPRDRGQQASSRGDPAKPRAGAHPAQVKFGIHPRVR